MMTVLLLCIGAILCVLFVPPMVLQWQWRLAQRKARYETSRYRDPASPRVVDQTAIAAARAHAAGVAAPVARPPDHAAAGPSVGDRS
jgi:hypothetical protein